MDDKDTQVETVEVSEGALNAEKDTAVDEVSETQSENAEKKETESLEGDPKEETVEADKDPIAESENETKEPETVEETVDVDDLLKDIDDKGAQVETLSNQYKIEQQKTEALTAKVKDLEAIVDGLVKDKLENIPEEFHGLLPSGGATEKLDWLNKAESSGLFAKKTSNPDIEIGKPLKTNDTKGAKDKPEKVSTQQKLSNYFSEKYSK